jgi:hypothetical protein
MAIAVIGGVITSTMLTLWVVPVVFLWIENTRRRLRGQPVAVAVPEVGTGAPPRTAAARGVGA